MSEPLVIVGNGMAAARLVDELTRKALGRYAIAVIGDEPRLAYNRVLLSSVLAGDVESSDIELKPASWWRNNGVTLRFGCAATAIDTRAKTVELADGERLPYSKLVLATGSQPFRPPVPGIDLPGVYTFRDSSDVTQLLDIAKSNRHVVVIGGGLLGLEAAYGVALAGARVTLLHLNARLMDRQLDDIAANVLKDFVVAKGIDVWLNAETASIEGENRVERLTLKDGTKIDCDAVIVAVGIRPNIALADGTGIAVDRGIKVDDHMQTNIPDVFALGECAEHRGLCYGLVEPAYEQARALANYLAAAGTGAYHGSITATNLKVSGVNVFSAGDFIGAGKNCIVFRDKRGGIYKKLVVDNDVLIGAVLIGDTMDANYYLDLIRTQASITAFRDDLMFGPPGQDLIAA